MVTCPGSATSVVSVFGIEADTVLCIARAALLMEMSVAPCALLPCHVHNFFFISH